MSAVTAPLFFVVVRRNGHEEPALYNDYLPAWMTGKYAKERGLVFALRLDKLTDAERWAGKTLAELWQAYIDLREKGALPASNLVDRPAARPQYNRGE